MILPVLLIGSSVLVTCVGFALKARLKTVGGYERQLAVAVPFLMLYDDTDLHLPPVSVCSCFHRAFRTADNAAGDRARYGPGNAAAGDHSAE